LKKKFVKELPKLSTSTKNRWINWIFHKKLSKWEIKPAGDMGFGLFTRQEIKLSEENDKDFISLFGCLDLGYVTNKENTYNSSFIIDVKIYPIYGLLSMVNHHCTSKFKFTRFSKNISSKQIEELHSVYKYPKGNFLNHHVMFITSFYDEYIIGIGDQLFVQYRGTNLEMCQCGSCKNNKTRSRLGKRKRFKFVNKDFEYLFYFFSITYCGLFLVFVCCLLFVVLLFCCFDVLLFCCLLQ
jgi:hypothetical protein